MRSRAVFFGVGIALLFAFLPAARSSQPQERSQATDCADDTWNPTSTANAPAGRQQHTAVWTGNEMIIWGGYGSGGSNDGGRYNPTADTWIPTSTNNPPSDRYQHTAIWTGNEMIIWGGSSGNSYFNTGGRYSVGKDSWINTSTVKAPDGRQDHTAVWTGSEMIVWGGDFYDGTNHYLNTGGRYNPDTDSWSATNTTNPPAGRTNHTAIWTGSEMIIWGGNVDASSATNTGGRYNPKSDTWTPTSTVGAPTARLYHTAVWTGTEMIVWGGFGFGGSNLNTGARYNPSTDTWTAINTTSAPVGRGTHTTVWTGSEMIIWGGYNGGTPLNSGGRYTLTTDSWTATSIPNPPSARVSYTAVWAGNEMIIWGGNGESGYLNTGGRYCARLVPQSAVSRKTHGAAGAFDIDLLASGTPGIECRTGGATSDHIMVITFPRLVTVNGNPQAAVTSGIGTVGSEGKPNGGIVFVSGNIVNVPLTNVANAQTINVTLFEPNGASNVVIPMSVLAGDVNGNGAVNASDVALTKSRIGQLVNQTNFRADVNAGGVINATDVALVKSHLGTGLP